MWNGDREKSARCVEKRSKKKNESIRSLRRDEMKRQPSKVVCVKRNIILHWIRDMGSKSACRPHIQPPCETICSFCSYKNVVLSSFFSLRRRFAALQRFRCHSCAANIHVALVLLAKPNEGKNPPASIIINWCLMSHREIYYVRCKVENVNGHKSTTGMITIRGRKTTHSDMRTTDEITLATLKLILCMLAVFAQRFFPFAATFVRYYVFANIEKKYFSTVTTFWANEKRPNWWVQLMCVEGKWLPFALPFH